MFLGVAYVVVGFICAVIGIYFICKKEAYLKNE